MSNYQTKYFILHIHSKPSHSEAITKKFKIIACFKKQNMKPTIVFQSLSILGISQEQF